MYIHGDERVITVASHVNEEITISLRDKKELGRLVLSSISLEESNQIDLQKITLKPLESLIISI
jgi:hypothetical protein